MAAPTAAAPSVPTAVLVASFLAAFVLLFLPFFYHNYSF